MSGSDVTVNQRPTMSETASCTNAIASAIQTTVVPPNTEWPTWSKRSEDELRPGVERPPHEAADRLDAVRVPAQPAACEL